MFEIRWKNCITVGVDSITVITGRHDSLLVELKQKKQNCKLMGCSCHIANATKEFCKALEGKFNVNNF